MVLTVKKEFLWFLILSIPLAILVGDRGATPDTQIYFDVLNISIIYFILQIVITLGFQASYLLDLYFSPLY